MGLLIDASFENHEGETCRVQLDKTGYTGTTFTDTDGIAIPVSWSLRHGAEQARFSIARQNTNATIEILGDSSTLFSELKAVYANDRTFQLTLSRAGTTVFDGWLSNAFVSTPRDNDQRRVVELRATPEAHMPEEADLEALSDDWVDSNGNRFTGDMAFSTAIANILQRTGFTFPVQAIIQWRPDTMASTDDPLSAQFRTDAFYRTGSDDKLRAMSAGAVLDDLVGTFNGHVLLREDNIWRIVQPEAKASGASNDVWEYDSSGTLKSGQPTTEPTTIDLTNEVRETDKDEPSVSGESPLNESRVIYEYGPKVGFLDFQGDMEEVNTPSDRWEYYDNGSNVSLANAGQIDVQTDATYVRNGAQALEIEGQEVSDATNIDNFNAAIVGDYAEHLIGGIDKDIGGMKLYLRAMPRVRDDDNDVTTVPDESRAFWALRLDVSGIGEPADNYFFVIPPRGARGGWIKEANLATDAEFNYFANEDFTSGSSYNESQFPISQVPEEGSLYLRLYHPVSRPLQGNDGSGFTVFCNWDDVAFERNTGTEPASTARIRNDSIETGAVIERTHRLGTGPFTDSAGYVLDDNGNEPDDWSVIGGSQQRNLQSLSALRLLRLRELPRQKWAPVFVQPDPEPKPGQAIEVDGTRYWPMLLEETQPDNAYQAVLVELAVGTSGVTESTLEGRSVSSAPGQRVITALQDLDDTEIPQLEDGKALVYDSDVGAFVLGGSAGGGTDIIPVDASGGNVTEQLPPPSSASTAVALRTDTSSNTATIADPNNNDIHWPGRADASSFAMYPHQAIFFASDGSRWHVENPAVYEIGSYVEGTIVAEQICLRHRARHDIRLINLGIDAEVDPASNGGYDFNVIVRDSGGAETTVKTVNLGQGSSRTNADVGADVPAEEIVKIQSEDSADPDLADVSFSFDVIRI